LKRQLGEEWRGGARFNWEKAVWKIRGKYHAQYTDKSCLDPLVYGYYYTGGLFAHVHRKGLHTTGEPY